MFQNRKNLVSIRLVAKIIEMNEMDEKYSSHQVTSVM